MASHPNYLRAFLSNAKNSLSAAISQSQKVTFVIGNESADLDSFTSSLLYAYIRSLAPPKSAFTPLYIPLLNIPAADIKLRPEFDTLCRNVKISPSHLITLDNLPPLSSIQHHLKPENTRWILVDHNAFQGALGEAYSQRVHGVIDHHSEENSVIQETDPEPRIIEKCGSCTSLVTRYVRPSWNTFTSHFMSSSAAHAQEGSMTDDAAVAQTWHAQVAKLALASILIDTGNMTIEWKVEQTDRDAVEFLESQIKASPKDSATWDRDSFYDEIDAAERSIEGLSFHDILRKDYKQWTGNEHTLGMSSVVKDLKFLIEKATYMSSEKDRETEFVTAIGDFMAERSLTIFAIMTISTSVLGEFQRELLLQATSTADSVAGRFSESATQELKLEKLDMPYLFTTPGAMQPSSEGPWRRMWRQKDVTKSRKQVAPLLREAMQAQS